MKYILMTLFSTFLLVQGAVLVFVVQLEHPVEVVLDHALVAARDEHEMLDAGLPGLVDHVLNERLVDDGQHFLRHRLGGGQDAGAETGDRKDGFADFHGIGESLASADDGGNAMLVAGLQPGTKADVWCDEKAADAPGLC